MPHNEAIICYCVDWAEGKDEYGERMRDTNGLASAKQPVKIMPKSKLYCYFNWKT